MRRLVHSIAFAAVAAAIGLAAGGAQAYCVYNRSSGVMEVFGELCARCFAEQISAGKDGCCPGDAHGCRGETWISWIPWPKGSPSKTLEDRQWDCSKKELKHPGKAAQGILADIFAGADPSGRLEKIREAGTHIPMYVCPHQVPAHGWVTVKGENGDLCHVKDKDGRILYDGAAELRCGARED